MRLTEKEQAMLNGEMGPGFAGNAGPGRDRESFRR